MGAFKIQYFRLSLLCIFCFVSCSQKLSESTVNSESEFQLMLASYQTPEWKEQSSENFTLRTTLVEESVQNASQSLDKFKKLKDSFKGIPVENFTFDALSSFISSARLYHVNPDQNGIYPHVNSFNRILQNASPAYNLITREDAEKFRIPNVITIKNDNDKEVLPLVLYKVEKLPNELKTKLTNSAIKTEQNLVLFSQNHSIETFKKFRELLDTYLKNNSVEMPPKEYKNFLLVQGYLQGLDPMTEILTADEVESLNPPAENVVGIGTTVREVNKQMKIIHIFPNTGAEAAQLQYGDIITSINGENIDLNKKSFSEWRSQLRGLEGSEVELTVDRKKTGILKLQVKRRPYIVEELEGMQSHSNWVVSMSRFQLETAEKLRAHLNQHTKASIILDLRGNPGGFLETALAAVQIFINEAASDLIYGKVRGGFGPLVESFLLTKPAQETDRRNIVILTDNSSASASEILAGSLQDYGRAMIIGERTFGKGTAQGVMSQRKIKELSLKVTTAYYFLHSHRTPQFEGIVPDVIVKRPQGEIKRSADFDNLLMSDMPGALVPVAGSKAITKTENPKLRTAIVCTQNSRSEVDAQYKTIVDEDSELADLQLLMAHKAIDCMTKAGL